jgi:glucan-binding YG repeat protein
MVTAVSFADTNDAEQAPGENVTVQVQEDQAADAVKGAEESSSEDAALTDNPPTTGWVYDQAAQGWKYYDPTTGAPALGKVLIGGATYFFDRTTGIMKTGLVHDTQTGDRYYCCPDGTDPSVVGSKLGAMESGWKRNLNGATYYFNPTSYKAKVGWLTDKDHKYYFGNNAKMKTGWLKLNNDKYYLEPKAGDTQGRMYTGKHKINGAFYFFADNGKMKTGWVNDGSYKYYYGNNGKMKKGWLSLNGSKYYLNKSNGRMYTGRHKIGNGYYFFNTSSGKMAKSTAIKIKGKLHYFFSSGKEVSGTGWFKGSDGKSRYAIGGGAVATGKKTINGITYVFSSKNGTISKILGDKYDQRIRNMSSGTGKLIYVVKGLHQVRVYKGSKNNWSKINTFTCELGAPSTPTRSGTYRVSGKTSYHSYKLNNEWVHWNNGVNFGSVGFNGFVWSGKTPPNGVLVQSHLGGNSSGGRVRVSEVNSVWLYNNIGSGTTVYVQ